VSESTLEAPPVAESAIPDRTPAPETVPWTLRQFVAEHPWWTVTVGLIVFSGLLIEYAGTRPSYDAYGWMVWGYQTLHGTLDLGGAPSWKPVPFLFTVPFALFGHYQLWLWMLTAAVVAFAGPVFAGRIAFRLTAADAPQGDVGGIARYAPWVAAVFAGAAVLGINGYAHYILSAQSDPMIVTFVLAAIDMFMLGRYRWTLFLGVLSSLGRPEMWPFLGLFMIWAWFRVPGIRWWLAAGVFAIAFMWFGIPWITNGRPDIAGQLAQASPRELKHHRFSGTLGRFKDNEYLIVWLAALGCAAWAAYKRRYAVLVLAAITVIWAIIEIAFAYHGWPALPRYMFEAAGIASVVAGVGVGWALMELRGGRLRLPQWSGAVVAGIAVVAFIPGAVSRLRAEHTDLQHERDRTHQIKLLTTITTDIGGASHVLSCGQPVTDVEYVSTLAWLYHQDVGNVGGLQQHVMGAELRNPALPKVLFRPVPGGGWSVLPWHTVASKAIGCNNVHQELIQTPSHPGGILKQL
jgi:hypothetical protein